ncbi:MAG: competence/damage-inducible protein A [Gemmatimonadales bacterium]
MNVEIVTIGDELLLGFTVDTNAAHAARELARIGVAVVRRATVGDSESDITSTVKEALDRTGAVITTGGLGPTSDDLTVPAVATVFGRALRFDDAVWDALCRRWKSYGWPGEIPESNRKQAFVPEGATILANNHGSAPGVWLEDDRGRWVATLPGVPREMRGMLADQILPRLRTRAGANPHVIVSRTLRTVGIGESALADKLGTLAKGPEGLPLAYLPGWEGVDLRLTSRDLSAGDAARALDAGASTLRAVLDDLTYGEDGTDLAAVVLQHLRDGGMKLAVAESCTGGLLGARLTAIPGSSDVMLGGVISYANAVKESHLDVRPETLAAHGAVSEETAREMATGVRDRLGADVGVSITGVAGPDGGTPDKPVGTVCFATNVRGAVRSSRSTLIGDRDEIRRRSTQVALNLVRRALRETATARPRSVG